MISRLHELRSEEVGGAIRVLLIEDNPGDAGLVRVALENSGETFLELHIEQRLEWAISRLSREKFHVVLLDLNLPDSQGFDTVTSVQEVVPRTPVIIMTGSTDETFARRAIQAGVQDYLVKDDVRQNTLVRSIFFAIERKRTENDLHSLEKVASAAISTLDMDSLLDVMLTTLRTEMGADRVAQMLWEDKGLIIKAEVGESRGRDDPDYRTAEERLNETVMNHNRPLYYELRGSDGIVKRTMLKAPLQIGGRAAGVVEVDWLGPHPESPRENSLLIVAAERIAGGIVNAKAYQALKRSEERAEEERLRLRTIIDTLPVGILITDARGRQVESNAFRAKIWGGVPAPSESIDDLCRMKAWWANTGEPVQECPVVRALRFAQTTIGAIIDIERLDGRTATILNSAAPITNERGETIGAVGVQEDITEQIRLERELSEAKERAEFYIDLLTHDINNSLSSASGYLQLICEAGGMSERSERWLYRAESSLDESIKLIDTIRKVQRSQSLILDNTPTDLDSVLGEVVEQARTREDGKADIEYRGRAHALVVGTDLLRDLFSNLIGNAVKHSPKGVRIEVNVRPHVLQGKDYIRVDVADNGPGIPDEVKFKIFMKGERGLSHAPGRGLGLFLAMSIVLRVGGRLWVEDRVPGDHTKGARFVVLLPLADRSIEPQ